MIFTIVGTRPNFIKIDSELPNQVIVHTGQHYDIEMSQKFFEELKLPEPKYNLNCKNKVGRMIDKLIKLFQKQKPTLILVFGDTHSSLAGALAGAYCNIPVVHIEAGLRSGNLKMPEEINRILIDKISKVRFCPTHFALKNLIKENLLDNNFVVGDPMFDLLGKMIPIERTDNWRKYLFMTLHRNFNADNKENLQNIFKAIEDSKEKVIFSIHPRTAENIKKFDIKIPQNIELIKPQSYKKTLSLISNAKKVLTDSGGVQKEAFWMSVPVIILRNETEWEDIILKDGGILVGDNQDKILDAILNFKGKINSPPKFGANKKIREIIYKYA